MVRSFTDRAFGGVCGGLGRALRVNPWLLRGGFILFTLVGSGAGVVLYLALWWLMPQESLITDQRGSALTFLLVLAVILLTVGGWVAARTGNLIGPDGQALFWPAMLVLLSLVFLVQQLRP